MIHFMQCVESSLNFISVPSTWIVSYYFFSIDSYFRTSLYDFHLGVSVEWDKFSLNRSFYKYYFSLANIYWEAWWTSLCYTDLWLGLKNYVVILSFFMFFFCNLFGTIFLNHSAPFQFTSWSGNIWDDYLYRFLL